MSTTRYQCPECSNWGKMKKIYADGKYPVVCKNCKAKLTLHVIGSMYWRPPGKAEVTHSERKKKP